MSYAGSCKQENQPCPFPSFVPVFLFGKIPAGGAGAEGSPGAAPPGFVSCCAVVRNLHRSVLVVPKSLGDAEEEVARLEKEAAEDSSRSKNLMAALVRGGGGRATRGLRSGSAVTT